MRLWTLHPKYLDTKGLVALWRESLLAKAVLEGLTRGYVNHPQLHRFRNTQDPLTFMNRYLMHIWEEGSRRKYSFDRSKLRNLPADLYEPMKVTDGQVAFEYSHLLSKLEKRDPSRAILLSNSPKLEVVPVFSVIPGDLEPWEKV